jgi:sensor histidine kinase YesM
MNLSKQNIFRLFFLFFGIFLLIISLAFVLKFQDPIKFTVFNTLIVYFILISNKILFEKYCNLNKISDISYFRVIGTFLISFLVGIIFYFILLLVWLKIEKEFVASNFFQILKNDYLNFIGLFFIVSLFFLVMELLKGWKNEAVEREQRKYNEIKFQFEVLKSQINPHFLFNSLNILNSIISEDPENAKRFVQNFSKIYRYILEKRDSDFVPLNDELKFIESYFYLIKSRHMNKIEFNITIDDSSKYMIIPMSLQLLVENAIKHNVATLNKQLKIKISIEDDYIIVSNNINPKNSSENSSQLGLDNLSKRYDYLTSKNIIINETNKEFTVKLPIINMKNR